jgi:hypothetical protein
MDKTFGECKMRNNNLFSPKWLIIILFGALISCVKVNQANPTPSILSTPISQQRITLTPTSTNNQVISITETSTEPTSTFSEIEATKKPTENYQLTYVLRAIGGSDVDKLFAIDISCIDGKQPCFSEPKLLFKALETGNGPQNRIFSHSWSPDGMQIALCAGGKEGKGDIFVTDITKMRWINITNSSIDECYPSWSPDGKFIAYTACSMDFYKGCRIFESTSFGNETKELLEKVNYLNPQNPVWMPDGKRISFETSDEFGHWQIFLANLDGSDLIQITNTEMDSNSPSISPDGRVIVFDRIRDQDLVDIFKVNLFSNEEEKILANASDRYADSNLAPFGKWIAFSSNRGISGGTNIFLVSIDGRNLIPITQGGGEYKRYPAWRYLTNP